MKSLPYILAALLGLLAAGCSSPKTAGAPDAEIQTGDGHAADTPDDRAEPPAEVVKPPTWWTEEATHTVDDLAFVDYQGQRLFGLGVHANSTLVYDGLSGPGECDPATGKGYLDINLEKTRAAYDAGANFAYLWGYGPAGVSLVDHDPRPFGVIRGGDGYGTERPVEQDLIPLIFEGYGEEDLDGVQEGEPEAMRARFEAFQARQGEFSPEAMPHLPDGVKWMCWHPTYRMIGGPSQECPDCLPADKVEAMARTTNMMIPDTYTYAENYYEEGSLGALIHQQKGPKGEGYEQWLERDDPDHRHLFSDGWALARSVATRRLPGAVVWMWLQGFSYTDAIRQTECEGKKQSSWAGGGFPPDRYLIKEITSFVAAGATGFVVYGYHDLRWPEAERIHAILRALASSEVYGPALLSPRLDLGQDLSSAGEGERAHLLVKWDPEGKRAFVIGANPGAYATEVAVEFPWSLEKAELLDWNQASFAPAADVRLDDRTLRYEIPKDSGFILRVTPRTKP